MKIASIALFAFLLVNVPVSGSDSMIDDGAAGWIWSGMESVGDPGLHGGSGHAGGPGSYGAYTFNGTGVDVYAASGPTVIADGRRHKMGSLKISIDGNLKAESKMFRADSDGYDDVDAYTIGNLPPGNHVLQVEPDEGWAVVDYITVHGASTSAASSDNGGSNGSGSSTDQGQASSKASIPVGKIITLRAESNSKLVSADYAQGKPLTANGDNVSALQQFMIEDEGNGYVALKSLATNLYVYVDPRDYSLYAGKNTVDKTVASGELFAWISNPDGTVCLQSFSNQLFVSADMSDNLLSRRGTLIAERKSPSTWEKFRVSTASN